MLVLEVASWVGADPEDAGMNEATTTLKLY